MERATAATGGEVQAQATTTGQQRGIHRHLECGRHCGAGVLLQVHRAGGPGAGPDGRGAQHVALHHEQ